MTSRSDLPAEAYTFDDPSYCVYIADAAKDCWCCSRCADRPCGGCLAGGVCDDFVCHCDDEPEDSAER